MNIGIRKISISFLVFLVATITINGQSSLGKENFTSSISPSAGESEKNAQSSEISPMAANETNNLSTIHSNTLKKFSPLDQKSIDQNQTEETSKPSFSTKHLFNAQILSQMLGGFKAPTQKKIGPLVPLQPIVPANYKIRVTFNSITVHNSHEGIFSGDGEYDLAVYVQGKKLSLTDAGGSGGGLWDVSSGETVTFPANTAVSVDVPGNLPISIFTVGSEVDGCDRTAFPEDVQDSIVSILFNFPLVSGTAGALHKVDEFRQGISDGINWIGCKLNPNDVLGVINKVYPPTGYGEGSHSEKSDAGDFTLRYTIAVTPPPAPPTTSSGQILGKLEQQQQLEQSPTSNQSSPVKGNIAPGLLSNLGKLNLTSTNNPTSKVDKGKGLLSALSGGLPKASSTGEVSGGGQVQSQNQTEETSKPSSKLIQPLKSFSLADAVGQTLPQMPKGKILTPLESPSDTYKVKVTFDSVTVHNDHEGVFSGDGEYDLAVYVQGKKLSLTDAGGSGGGLWDVSSGETVTFPANTAVSVDVPGNLPLSIFTVGSEVDGCGRTAFPDDIKSIIVSIFTSTNPGDWLRGVMNIHDYIEGRINWVGCKLNPNDTIGIVNKVYDPTAYGAGSHEEKSDSGDFTLRYSIGVTPPLPISAVQK
ncbi:MAG: hypothetical protein ABJB85_06610 [Nitrososphaerota archaeon]